MQSLFPSQPAASNQPISQFKAGKCHLNKLQNGKFQVTADKRRGQVSLVRGNDGLLHFRWVNLSNGNVEDDRIVMPGEGAFKKVKTGREDRVYMLQFDGSEVPLMFWMQDIDKSKDEGVVREMNNSLNSAPGGNQNTSTTQSNNNPPWMQFLGNQGNAGAATTASSSGAAGGNVGTNIGGLDFASLLSAFGVNNQQQNQSSAANNMATPTPAQSSSLPPLASPTPQHGTSALSIDDIRRAMEGRPAATNETPSLSDILNAEEILSTGVLTDPAVQNELLATLPQEHQSLESLEATLRSAQVQQAAQSFSHALQQTENFQSIVTNFNFDPSAGFNQLNQGDGVGAFIAALQAANPPTANPSSSTEAQESKDNNETKMDESH